MSIYDYTVKDRKGNDVPISIFKGKVLLIVNTATGCGFTPQYEGLEKLYKEYKDKGFEILDFPCNQFGNQAPGSNDEIHEFCTLKYNTTFDQFAKVEVNGENEIPLYSFLKKEKGGISRGYVTKTGARLLSNAKVGSKGKCVYMFMLDTAGNKRAISLFKKAV